MNNEVLRDWEPVRKDQVTQLVSVNVTDMAEEERRSVIKSMSTWVEKFKRSYEKLVVKSVTDFDTASDFVTLDGIRKETEEEARDRLGIKDSESWSVQYRELTNCSPAEAKAEMFKMLNNGKPLTPEEWQKYKYDQVEAFLNVKPEKKETE